MPPLDNSPTHYKALEQDHQNLPPNYVVSPGIETQQTFNLNGEIIKHSESYYVDKERNWMQKSFGKVKQGSMRSTLTSLLQGTVGAGILGLPVTFRENGLVTGCIFTIVIGIICRLCTRLLFEAAYMRGCNRYSKLIKECFGETSSKCFQLFLFLYLFGVIISYQILIGQMIVNIIKVFTDVDESQLRVYVIMAVTVISFPLMVQRDFSKLQFLSLFGFCILIFIILLVVIETPLYLQYQSQKPHLHKTNIFLMVSMVLNVFSYTCSGFVFEVSSQMKYSSKQRIHKVHDRFYMILIVVQLILCIFAYISSVDQLPDIVLYRDSYDGKVDVLMQAAQLGMSIYVFFGMSVNANPGRASLNLILFQKEYYNLFAHVMTTLVMLVLPALIAILFPQIITAFSILGGYGSIMLTIFLPCLCYVNSNSLPITSPQNLLILVGGSSLTVTSVIAATLALLEQFGYVKIR